MFDKMRLFTRDGHEIVTVNIPHFDPKAEVIVWGSRTFILSDEDNNSYVEGMMWTCPSGSEVK